MSRKGRNSRWSGGMAGVRGRTVGKRASSGPSNAPDAPVSDKAPTGEKMTPMLPSGGMGVSPSNGSSKRMVETNDTSTYVPADAPVPEVVAPHAPFPPAWNGVAAAATAAEPVRAHDRDDASFPPVDIDRGFFNRARPHVEHFEFEDGDPHFALKLTPQVARRRAELQKYVKLAVGISALVCIAALGKMVLASARARAEGRLVARSHETLAPIEMPADPLQIDRAQRAAAVAAQPTPSQAPAEEIAVNHAEPAPPTTVVAPAPVVPVASSEPATPAPTATPKTHGEPPQEPQLAADPEQARREKRASQDSLEHGKVKASIAAGERSVAFDPTDGEAWLILGAAYQMAGNAKDARRCYQACVQKGSRGPRYECTAMLR